MKKRIFSSITICFAISLILSGCSESNVQDNTEAAASTEVVTESATTDDGISADGMSEEALDSYEPSSSNVSDVYEPMTQQPYIDISDCDTFTQIVEKLKDGMGYANTTIGDAEVLLVSSGTYEWEPGHYAAIDADIFIYQDGIPTYLGTVCAGGTAYPLEVADGYLYVGGNHYMTKYIIDNGAMVELEEAYVTYDTEGNDTYYYKTCNSQFEDYDEETAKSRFDELFAELDNVEVIEFQPVG